MKRGYNERRLQKGCREVVDREILVDPRKNARETIKKRKSM